MAEMSLAGFQECLRGSIHEIRTVATMHMKIHKTRCQYQVGEVFMMVVMALVDSRFDSGDSSAINDQVSGRKNPVFQYDLVRGIDSFIHEAESFC